MGHLLKIKCVDSRVNVHILASTSVPLTLTTAQVPNLALTHKKRITVHNDDLNCSLVYPYSRNHTRSLSLSVILIDYCHRLIIVMLMKFFPKPVPEIEFSN